MRRIHTSIPRPRAPFRTLRVWLSAVALFGVCGALAPTAGAAPTTSTASVTDATTGLPDASSVVPLDACGSPTALRAACLAKVLGVRGTHSFVHPRLRRPASPVSARRPTAGASGAGRAPATVAAAAAPQPGTPAYLQQAYDLAYLSQTAGAGATIAIVDAFDDPNAEADLAIYRAEFCASRLHDRQRMLQQGRPDRRHPLPATTRPGLGAETSLDLDAVSALCPNCHIVLVEANSDQHLGPRRGAGGGGRSRAPAPSPIVGR